MITYNSFGGNIMFKLTEEQIIDIIQNYGGSRRLIAMIEHKLNFLGVVLDEEDYFELITAIVSQKETINFKLESCSTKKEAVSVFISLDEIIVDELNRKYNNFENAREDIKQKVKSFGEQKIRHN